MVMEAFGHPPFGESPQAGEAEGDGGEGDQQAEQRVRPVVVVRGRHRRECSARLAWADSTSCPASQTCGRRRKNTVAAGRLGMVSGWGWLGFWRFVVGE